MAAYALLHTGAGGNSARGQRSVPCHNKTESIEKIKGVKYLFVDGIFLLEDKQIIVIDTYRKVLDNIISKEEGLKIIDGLDLVYANKFMNMDSVYNPEDF